MKGKLDKVAEKFIHMSGNLRAYFHLFSSKFFSWRNPAAMILAIFAISFLSLNYIASFGKALISAIIAFFMGSFVYAHIIKGGKVGKHTLRNSLVSTEGFAYIIFFLAIITSTIISDYVSGLVVKNVVSTRPNGAKDNLILSWMIAIGLFLLSRMMFYRAKMFTATTAFLGAVLMALGVWFFL